MNITLKGFSQDVNLSDLGKVQYFLVFDAGGRSLRLPVLQETTEELAKFLYGNEDSKEGNQESIEKTAFFGMSPDDEEKGAEEFGGDYQEEEPEEDVEGPSNEEEIPSL